MDINGNMKIVKSKFGIFSTLPKKKDIKEEIYQQVTSGHYFLNE